MNGLSTTCDSSWISSMLSKGQPFSCSFIFGRDQSHREPDLANGWMGGGNGSRWCFRQRGLCENKRTVRGRIVVLQRPISWFPKLKPFASNILTELSQNITIELGIDCLTSWNEFSVHYAYHVKKKQWTCSFHCLFFTQAFLMENQRWQFTTAPIRQIGVPAILVSSWNCR